MEKRTSLISSQKLIKISLTRFWSILGFIFLELQVALKSGRNRQSVHTVWEVLSQSGGYRAFANHSTSSMNATLTLNMTRAGCGTSCPHSLLPSDASFVCFVQRNLSKGNFHKCSRHYIFLMFGKIHPRGEIERWHWPFLFRIKTLQWPEAWHNTQCILERKYFHLNGLGYGAN